MNGSITNALKRFSISKGILITILLSFVFIIFSIIAKVIKLPLILVPVFIGIAPLLLMALYVNLNTLCLLQFFFLYFRPHEFIFILSKMRSFLFIIVGLYLSFFINLYSKRIKFYNSIEDRLIIINCILFTFSMMLAKHPDWYDWIVTIANFMSAIIIGSSLRQRQDFVLFQKFVYVIGIMLLQFSIIKTYNNIGLSERLDFNLSGKHSYNANDLANLLIFVLGAYTLVLLRWNESNFKKIITIAIIAFILYAILLTRSRTGIFCMLTLYFVIGYYKAKNKKLFSIIYLLGAIMLGSIFFAMIQQNRSDLDVGESFGSDDSAQIRKHLMRAGILAALHNPLLGVGPDNFKHVVYQYLYTSTGIVTTIHNLWINLFVEEGIFFLIITLVLVIKAFISFTQCLKILDKGNPRDEQLYSIVLGLLAAYSSFCVYVTFNPSEVLNVYNFCALSLALKRLIILPNNKD